MDRWNRALAQDDAKFKELFGVKKEIALQMYQVLSDADEKRRKRGGPRLKRKLSVGDQLLMTLQYWREYRTMQHIGYDFGVAKSTVSDTISQVEKVLIQDKRFHLPGKKALLCEENAERTLAVDVTESPVERPKKNKKTGIQARKSDIRKKPK